MKKIRVFPVSVIMTLIVFLFLGIAQVFAETLPENLTVTLTETSEAFKNPLKGFRPSRFMDDSKFKDYEYSSTYKHYIKYTDLEKSESDSVDKIKAWSDVAWAGIESKNIKVIPRVLIVYPQVGEYWPDGIPHGNGASDWTSAQLKTRLASFVAKLGKAWDNDPRVGAIELGLWGKWGEHHIYPDKLTSGSRIPADFQKALGDAATAAFKNKKVMVRYPETFTAYNFGYLWDSFALPNDIESANGMISRDSWRTQMNSGEVAYDWGDQSKLGGSPNGTLSSAANTNYVIDWIKKTHTSSLGWIAQYDASIPEVEINATKMQKAMGYRFVVKEANFQKSTVKDGTLDVSFKVANVGSAPFYYNWPIEASLLKADKSVAWTGIFNTDITKFLPGNEYAVSGKFNMTNIENGTYTLALSILDPAGNKPSIRFANTNYYKGGRTPVGKVGIGQQPINQSLGLFDGLKNDNTLSYSLIAGTTPIITPVPTPTPTPVEKLILNDFTNGWPGTNNLNNWANASVFANGSGTVLNGELTLIYNENGWFGSQIFKDLSKYKYLVIRIKGNNGGEQTHFKVKIGNALKFLSEYTTTPITKDYQDIKIDLLANGVNTSYIDQVNMEFWYNKSGGISIDEIRFETQLVDVAPVPIPVPTPIPVPVPTPIPVPKPIPVPTPIPVPVPVTVPVPTPIPVPTPVPIPIPTPIPAPVNSLMVNDFKSVWPGNNNLNNWAGASGFDNRPSGTALNGELTFTYNANGWFGTQINKDMSKYKYLVIRIKGSVGGEQGHFKLRVGNAYKMFDQFTKTPITKEYQDVKIDLAANKVLTNYINQINMEFWYNKRGTIIIDEIRFE